MPLAARQPISAVLGRAHNFVYREFLDPASLVKALVRELGRPTIARLTGAPDLKTVSRWSLGRNPPSNERLDILRTAATFYYALLDLGLTPANAEQWFRGSNPALGFAMPVDVLRERRYEEVEAALLNHASE